MFPIAATLLSHSYNTLLLLLFTALLCNNLFLYEIVCNVCYKSNIDIVEQLYSNLNSQCLQKS